MVGPMALWRPGDVFTVWLLFRGWGCSPPPLSTRRAIRERKWSGCDPGSSSSSSESAPPLLCVSDCVLRALSCPEYTSPLIPLLGCARPVELASEPDPLPTVSTAVPATLEWALIPPDGAEIPTETPDIADAVPLIAGVPATAAPVVDAERLRDSEAAEPLSLLSLIHI